jgi:hypothetical protein
MNSTLSTTPSGFLESTSELFVRPLHYTIVLGMFTTRWWWYSDGVFQGPVFIRFDHCRFLHTKWLGSLGPYTIDASGTNQGLLDVRDESGEFRVVCESLQFLGRADLPRFFRNMSRIS